jgi:sugar (pentulose or hexulose) kinase
MDTYVGIELGSTRVKVAVIDRQGIVVGSAISPWNSELVDGYWTYSLDEAWECVQRSFREAIQSAPEETVLKSIGISGMMHGYLAIGHNDALVVPFRTWKNTNTGEAAAILTELLNFNVPLRWSAAHLLQAVLNGEPHVSDISFITTLAGYIHWRLTGERLLGIGDASGMFPVDSSAGTYDQQMMARFGEILMDHGADIDPWAMLPGVVSAGQDAGRLSKKGALLLDPSGNTAPGIPLCPPEGDAGTGMVATNSTRPRTGNVSVGTSIFAMVVLQHPLKGRLEAIDVVTTPTGTPVAMVHCNNGAEELRAWVQVFQEFAELMDFQGGGDEVFEVLLRSALDAPRDGSGMTVFNFGASEPLVGVTHGQPMVLWDPSKSLSLGSLFRAHVYSVFAALRIGLDVLRAEEGISIEGIVGHGGIFRTPIVAQRLLAAAVDMPVLVGHGAGEGGAWGMAVLALFSQRGNAKSLEQFLDEEVFASSSFATIEPDIEDKDGFAQYLNRFVARLRLQARTNGAEEAERYVP